MTLVPNPGRGAFPAGPSHLVPHAPANCPHRPRHRREAGELDRDWPTRGPVLAGYLALALLVGGFGGWSLLTQIAGAVVTEGRIEVERNQQVVQHPDGGVVAEIVAREGDIVSAGDLLVRLDPDQLRSDLSIVEGELFEVLARRGRFEAERDSREEIAFPSVLALHGGATAEELMEGQERLLVARMESDHWEREQLDRQREQLESQIDGFAAQQQAFRRQLELIAEELVAQQSLLERGLTQAARVLDLQRDEAALRGRIGEADARIAETRNRLIELGIEVERLGSTRREEANAALRDLEPNEIELTERRAMLLSRLDRLEIRAPVSGVVLGMTVFAERSVVRPAEPVLYIVPQDRPLVITTRVQLRDVDQVRPGQAVGIRFPAFETRTTPELFGHVVQVSADAFTDQASGASYYRAEVALDAGEAARLPDGLHLMPGMPVEAFLATKTRSPMAYLTKPFTDFFARVFREA